MSLKWPWVSRAAYDALAAELDAERKRARRRGRRGTATEEWRKISAGVFGQQMAAGLAEPVGRGAPVVNMADATADTTGTLRVNETTEVFITHGIQRAIREAAGGDRPLARHLRTFALEQLAAEVDERDVIAAIRRGQQVAL